MCGGLAVARGKGVGRGRLPDGRSDQEVLMKHQSLIILGLALLLRTSVCQAQTARRWSFDRNGDRENWTIPADARGAVMGGSLWLTLGPKETDPEAMATTGYQAFGDLETASKGYEALRREKLDLNLASSSSKICQGRCSQYCLSSRVWRVGS